MIDFFLHSDKKLLEIVSTYGSWVYAVLFAIVFAETGFVVTPFLPGDSLLFATGALCATGALSTPLSLGLLALAAFTRQRGELRRSAARRPARLRATDQSATRIACSTASICSARTSFSRTTAARPSFSAASSPSSARSCRLSRAPRR